MWTNLSFFLFLTIPYFIRVCELFTTAVFVLFPASTRTLYSHIICIICIYNITCISVFSRLGNIYIICIIRTIYIINISLLWTNCGHSPHPFTPLTLYNIYYKKQIVQFIIQYHFLYFPIR